MGLSAVVIVYPTEVPAPPPPTPGLFKRLFQPRPSPPPRRTMPPATKAEREQLGRAILELLEKHGFVRQGLSRGIDFDQEPTFATGHSLDEDSPVVAEWTHCLVEPRDLLPPISQIIFTATEEEWSPPADADDRESNERDERPVDKHQLRVPVLEITVLPEPIPVRLVEGSAPCSTWVFVEFSFEDARYSEDIHFIANNTHPIFSDLRELLGFKVTWDVILG